MYNKIILSLHCLQVNNSIFAIAEDKIYNACMDKNYKFFSNKDCEYFPCHDGVEEGSFNCLFCYCPLYVLGESCGGNFSITKKGIKDCSGCNFPHQKGNYDEVIDKIRKAYDMKGACSVQKAENIDT